MTDRYLLAIDQGTTSSRAIIFNAQGQALHTQQKELTQHYPQPSWVEHNANDIWNDTLTAARGVINKAGGAQSIASIGITNQRETTIIWNRDTGVPIYNAIVWQDRRTAAFCQGLKNQGHEKTITQKTGLLIDPYFSCSKIKWILDHVEGARDLAGTGKLAFGTVECFLLWKLTSGRTHASDFTNAARTGLYNITENRWDEWLLDLYDIPRAILPEVHENIYEYGSTDPDLFGTAIPIGGMAGDQHAALIGQGCFQSGMIKSTYGTGCFALMNIGDTFKTSQNRLLTTPAYRIGGKTSYAIEGSIFMAGATIQWLRDALNIIDHASETEALAQSLSSNEGVYLIPAFTGLGAPYWQAEVKAAIFGLTRGSDKAHLARAALEAQAYQTYDLLGAMHSDTGINPTCLRVDGGLVANKFVCQFLADITHCSIEVPNNTETTALGAAFLAGLSAGIYQDLDEVASIWALQQSYNPSMESDLSSKLINEWHGYVEKLL